MKTDLTLQQIHERYWWTPLYIIIIQKLKDTTDLHPLLIKYIYDAKNKVKSQVMDLTETIKVGEIQWCETIPSEFDKMDGIMYYLYNDLGFIVGMSNMMLKNSLYKKRTI